MASAAMAVFDPGSCQGGGDGVSGTYRGYPVVLDYRIAARSHGGGRGYILGQLHGPTGGVRFTVSIVPLLPDPQYQITGDPAFDSRYDVRGAPMVVLRWLFADPDLRARMLSVPTTSFDLEPVRLQFCPPKELDPDALRTHLDIACAVFERLPGAIQQSGALAATGGRSLEFHPEVQARVQQQSSIRVLVFVLIGLFVGLPLLGVLLVVVMALAC